MADPAPITSSSAGEVDPGAPPHHQRLRERRAVDGADRVREHLDLLAGADLADAHDDLAHRLQQRHRALQVGVAAARHDRQRPVLGLRGRACDGGVDEAVAALRQRAADPAGVDRPDRGHVDEQRPGLGARRGAVVAEQHLLDLGAVDHHRDHDVAALTDLARRRGDLPAVLGRPLLGALTRAVEDRQLVALAPEARRHPRPHDPEPYEPDIHAKALARACECE